MHRLSIVAQGLLGVLAGVGTVGQSSAEAQSALQEVTRVDFLGSASFSDAELRRAVLTKASSCPPILTVTTCALGLDWFRDRQILSTRVLEDDVARLIQLYRSNGFRGTTVVPEVTPAGVAAAAADGAAGRGADGQVDREVTVTFHIDEGMLFRVGSIEFLGDPLPGGENLDAGLPISPGDPASVQIFVTSDTLTERLRNAGYAFAEVFYGFDRARGSDTASVNYRVELGPRTTFGPIDVRGNSLLTEEVIVERLPFREGDLFRESALREAQRSLHGIGLVTRAVVERDTESMEVDSVLPIRVEVVEGDVHRFRTGGGANSADCFNVEGRWTSRNFAGGGRTLQVQGRLSNLLADALQSTPLCSQAGTGDFGRLNWLTSIDFTQPNLVSRRSDLSIGLFAERQSAKNIFVRDGLGVDVGVSTRLGAGSFVSVRYRPQISRLEAAQVTLCATFLACTPDDIDVLSSTNWLSPVALSFNRDGSDDLFNPTRGARALVDLEFSDRFTGSDYAYIRTFADASLYNGLGDSGAVLALRVRTGRIRSGGFLGTAEGTGRFADVVPSQKRFYGGGANSVRGFPQSSLGPTSLSIGVEQLLRRPAAGGAPACGPRMVADLSCDASALDDMDLFQLRPVGGLSTFEASAELRFALAGDVLGGAAFVDVGQVWPGDPALSELEMSPGLGVRYNTAFGPLRLDLAYSFRDAQPLQVVTSQVRPYVPGLDADTDRIDIAVPGGQPEWIEWVVSNDLAILAPTVAYGDDEGFSLRRFQLHFSIGQAF